MSAWISPGLTERSTPLTISVPSSSETRRSFSSSSDTLCGPKPFLQAGFPPGMCHRSEPFPGRSQCYSWPMPGNIGWQGAIIILIVLLVVFGPKRLPEMGRSLGKGMREFKDSVTGHDDPPHELPRTPEDEPVTTRPRDDSVS